MYTSAQDSAYAPSGYEAAQPKAGSSAYPQGYLTILDGTRKGDRVPLIPADIMLGSSPNTDVMLTDQGISESHATDLLQGSQVPPREPGRPGPELCERNPVEGRRVEPQRRDPSGEPEPSSRFHARRLVLGTKDRNKAFSVKTQPGPRSTKPVTRLFFVRYPSPPTPLLPTIGDRH